MRSVCSLQGRGRRTAVSLSPAHPRRGGGDAAAERIAAGARREDVAGIELHPSSAFDDPFPCCRNGRPARQRRTARGDLGGDDRPRAGRMMACGAARPGISLINLCPDAMGMCMQCAWTVHALCIAHRPLNPCYQSTFRLGNPLAPQRPVVGLARSPASTVDSRACPGGSLRGADYWISSGLGGFRGLRYFSASRGVGACSPVIRAILPAPRARVRGVANSFRQG